MKLFLENFTISQWKRTPGLSKGNFFFFFKKKKKKISLGGGVSQEREGGVGGVEDGQALAGKSLVCIAVLKFAK